MLDGLKNAMNVAKLKPVLKIKAACMDTCMFGHLQSVTIKSIKIVLL